MTNSIAKRRRTGYYDRLYSDRNFSIEEKLKKGVWYLQAVDPKTRKNFGRPFSKDGKTHHLLYKLFPNKIPPYKDFVTGTKRLVKSDRRNITSSFKAKDWKDLGFSTAKQGKYFVRALKLPVKTKDDLDNIVKMYNKLDDKSVFKSPYKLDQYSRKLLGLFKNNLGRFNVKDTGQQFKGSHQSYELTRIGVYRDVYVYLNNVKKFILRKILQYMSTNGSCKFSFSVNILFKRKILVSNEVVPKEMSFFSEPVIVANKGEISSKVSQSLSKITEKVNKMVQSGSGWVVDTVKTSHINIYKYNLHTGSSYFELPKSLKNRVINIKNEDNRCFLYSLLVGLHRDELNLSRTDRLKQFDKFFDMYPFDYSDMPMTTDVSSKIRKYEDIIKHNINILLWTEKDGINPFYYTHNNHEKTLVLMLCIERDKSHFVYVPDLSRLLSSTLSKHKHKSHFCLRCLANFSTENALEDHLKLCSQNEISKVEMSKKDHLNFIHYEKMLKLPFVVYADFECIVCKTSSDNCPHKPCGAKYIIISSFSKKPIRSFTNRGENCVSLFLDNLVRDCKELYNQYFRKLVTMETLTQEQNQDFLFGETCHICQKGGFVSPEENKLYRNQNNNKNHPNSRVRDHCHFTGKFRGLAHNECNMKYQVKRLFPVVFHNLRGYDSHFIIKNLKPCHSDKIKSIPLNNEKFISFSLHYTTDGIIHRQFFDEHPQYETAPIVEYANFYDINKKVSPPFEIRFIDSYAFLSSSLDCLSQNLETKDFKQTMLLVKELCPYAKNPAEIMDLFCLLKRKGFYPYEYADSFDKFSDNQLPPKHAFISKLQYETDDIEKLNKKDRKSIDDGYIHAQKVWDSFRCQNFGDYHDLYLSSDIAILTDIFENFRNLCLDKFKLDPCHYYTLPGLSFDGMLKHTGVSLELFTEEKRDFYLTMEQAKIGGISGTGGKRYAVANNKYLSNYDPNQPSSFINYNDANGLYSWAETIKLPDGDFEDYTTKFNLDDALNDIDGDYGYFLSIDAHIPDNLHDYFNDYCPFPENDTVPKENYTNYQVMVNDLTCKALSTNTKPERKLIPNLKPKKNYLIHIRLLKLFLDLGCKLDKIHFVLRFHQSYWLKPWIDLCMGERQKQGISEFEKDFWKLNCNGVYGKFLENVRNHVSSEIVYTQQKFDKLVQKNTFQYSTQLNDNGLVFVQRLHSKVVLNKPLYIGVAILQISKCLMYDFFYNTLRKKYPDSRLLYTDTDSFIYEVFTDDFYADIIKDPQFLEKFDLSNYKEDHPIFSGLNTVEIRNLINKNYKVLGKFKDEYGGKVVREFIGLRSKMYSMIDEEYKQKNTGKGIKKVILTHNLQHQKYRDCILHNFNIDKMIQFSKMNFIHSKNHNVYSEELTKVTLSSMDDKRAIMDNGIDQLAWGHWRLDQMRKNNKYEL